MIYLSRLNQEEYWLNPDLIETIESTPDTVITLSNEKKYIVCDTPEDIVQKIINYKQKLLKPTELIKREKL